MIEFVMLQKESHRTATMFGLAGLLTGVVAHSNLGAVFGLLNAREFWHGPYMPIYFITSAAMSGCVAIIFFTYLAYRANGWKMSDDMKKSLSSVAKMGALMMAVILFFTSWKMIAGVTGNLYRLLAEYRITERRSRALENIILPEIEQSLREMSSHLEELELEDAIRVRLQSK